MFEGFRFQEGDIYSETFTLTEDVYNSFKESSKDMNPLHTDENFARNKGFGGRVMYGNILNAFISYFIGECLPVKNVIIQRQEINFKKPVYLNDVLRLEVSVIETHESINVVIFKFCFINQADIIVANGKIQIGILK